MRRALYERTITVMASISTHTLTGSVVSSTAAKALITFQIPQSSRLHKNHRRNHTTTICKRYRLHTSTLHASYTNKRCIRQHNRPSLRTNQSYQYPLHQHVYNPHRTILSSIFPPPADNDRNKPKRPPCKSPIISSIKDIPNPRLYNSWIVDCANIIPDDVFMELNQTINELYEKYHHFELAIVTVKDIQARSSASAPTSSAYQSSPTESAVRYFVTELFNYWKIGDVKHQNGCLMFIHLKLRRIEIITGRGISGVDENDMNALLAGEWLRQMQVNYMIPLFKKGLYADGIRVGVEQIAARLKGYYTESLTPAPPRPSQQIDATSAVSGDKNMLSSMQQQERQSFGGGTASSRQQQRRNEKDEDDFKPALHPYRIPIYRQRTFQMFVALIATVLGYNYYSSLPTKPRCKNDGSKHMTLVAKIDQYRDCSQYIPPTPYGQASLTPPNATTPSTPSYNLSQQRENMQKYIQFPNTLRNDDHDDPTTRLMVKSRQDTESSPTTDYGGDMDNRSNEQQEHPFVDTTNIDINDPCALQTQLLDAGQRTELKLRAREFAVYRCDECSSLQAVPIEKPSFLTSTGRYEDCPNCHYRTAVSRVIQIAPASRMSDGQQQVTARCLHCSYQETQYQTIPRVMQRDYYPPATPSSNSDGSSFGGGGSSGTGAGSSW